MKYYVVRKGRKQGIYNNRNEAKSYIDWYPWAKYKSFPTLESAQQAYENNFLTSKGIYSPEHLRILMGENFQNSIATDAACPSNPGPIEYRWVEISTQKEIFSIWPLSWGSTNLAEYLAIVDGLQWLSKQTKYSILYSDSKIAIGRVEKNTLNTTIQENNTNTELWNIIRHAQEWLWSNPHWPKKITLKKRPTKLWGQIPADFGRK